MKERAIALLEKVKGESEEYKQRFFRCAGAIEALEILLKEPPTPPSNPETEKPAQVEEPSV